MPTWRLVAMPPWTTYTPSARLPRGITSADQTGPLVEFVCDQKRMDE